MASDPKRRDAPPNGTRPNGFSDLPIIETDETLDEFGDRPTVLITGASGLIGRALRSAWGDRYDLILIDSNPRAGDSEVIPADLAEQDESWMGVFHGADAVVHLAANPDPTAPWDELVGPNIDATANVLQASVLGAVDRLVFASSSHVMGGYRDDHDGPIFEDLPPKPDGPYGASKLVGERLGRSFAAAFDLSIVALRIGLVQRPPDLPSRLPDDRARMLWLSHRDLAQIVDLALWADLDDGFLVVNAASRNRGGRWPIDRAVEALGYSPVDDAFATRT